MTREEKRNARKEQRAKMFAVCEMFSEVLAEMLGAKDIDKMLEYAATNPEQFRQLCRKKLGGTKLSAEDQQMLALAKRMQMAGVMPDERVVANAERYRKHMEQKAEEIAAEQRRIAEELLAEEPL